MRQTTPNLACLRVNSPFRSAPACATHTLGKFTSQHKSNADYATNKSVGRCIPPPGILLILRFPSLFRELEVGFADGLLVERRRKHSLRVLFQRLRAATPLSNLLHRFRHVSRKLGRGGVQQSHPKSPHAELRMSGALMNSKSEFRVSRIHAEILVLPRN